MLERDLFVALVAFGLGWCMIYAALQNSPWYFQLHSARMMERSIGRTGARFVIGTVGTMVVLMGVYVLFAPAGNKTTRSKQGESMMPNFSAVFSNSVAAEGH